MVVCGGHPPVMKLSKYGGGRWYGDWETELNRNVKVLGPGQSDLEDQIPKVRKTLNLGQIKSCNTL